jgi:leader peptidase (prepilin peptidase) / N-methyltransferase
MHLGVTSVAGILGGSLGAFATGFALSVPPKGRLPRPTLWPFADRQRSRVTLTGAVVSGAVCMVLGTVLGSSLVMPAYSLCGVLGVALAIVDVRTRRLPYAMTGVMFASCAVAFGVSAVGGGDARPLIRAVLAAALASTGFLGLALAFPGQLGLGDVVLVGWVAFSLAWFGWRVAVVGLLTGLIIQAAVGILVLVRAGPRGTLPMGPALLIGWLVGVLVAAS